MDKQYKPDIILIACNTLSVIYKETEFAKHSKTKLIGIISFWVDIIKENLLKSKNSKVIIFGTNTTIEENTYKKELLKDGVSENLIITKAYPQLQAYIENNPNGDETEMLIYVYVGEVLQEIGKSKENIYISLNCSHYGYSEKFLKSAFEIYDVKIAGILNPNNEMATILMPDNFKNRYKKLK